MQYIFYSKVFVTVEVYIFIFFLQAFMNWKFPSRLPPLDSFEMPEAMEQVAHDQLESTYQSDYTGIPQGTDKGLGQLCNN